MMQRGAWKPAWMPLFLALVLLPSMARGQAESVFQILENGQPIGRGTVVEKSPDGSGLGITARHVLAGRMIAGELAERAKEPGDVAKFAIRYSSGRQSKAECWCVRWDEFRDLALIQVWVPEDVPAIPVGTLADMLESDPTVMVGKAGHAVKLKPVSLMQSKHVFFDGQLVPGDSGGAVVSNGKLIGVISGGWFWCEPDLLLGTPHTWPIRAGRVDGFFPEAGE